MDVMGYTCGQRPSLPAATRPLRDATNGGPGRRRRARPQHPRVGAEYLPASRAVAMRGHRPMPCGLLATGGRTNHTMLWWRWRAVPHFPFTWNDFSDRRAVVPLLTRISRMGSAAYKKRSQMPAVIAFLDSRIVGNPATCTPIRRTCDGGSRLRAYFHPNHGSMRVDWSWRPAPAAKRDFLTLCVSRGQSV